MAYAVVDDSILFEQRRNLMVDGRWLERVPGLAICQDFDTLEYSVQYCDADWEPLAISGNHPSVEDAKSRVELSYHGVRTRWIAAPVTFEDAQAVHEAELKEGACSFCGKTPLQVAMMFGDQTRICGDCVSEFHQIIHTED